MLPQAPLVTGTDRSAKGSGAAAVWLMGAAHVAVMAPKLRSTPPAEIRQLTVGGDALDQGARSNAVTTRI